MSFAIIHCKICNQDEAVIKPCACGWCGHPICSLCCTTFKIRGRDAVGQVMTKNLGVVRMNLWSLDVCYQHQFIPSVVLKEPRREVKKQE